MTTQDKFAALLIEVLNVEQNYQGSVYISVSEAAKEGDLRKRIKEALTDSGSWPHPPRPDCIDPIEEETE
tara:strand:- start:1504 stop:1713 length:210 start_codon:yes stop_codon:yes gene_type:complete